MSQLLSSQPSQPSQSPEQDRIAFWQRMLICVVIGFSSGLPLFVFLNLIPAWADDFQLDVKAIGLLTFLQVPYVGKPLWAPMMDWINIRALGRRKTWMIILPMVLTVLLIVLGMLRPDQQMGMIVLVGVLISFASASLDIVIDAYRRELLPDSELGLGNTIHVNAYKLAGLIPGGLGLILAEQLPWPVVFAVVGAFMLPCVLLGLVMKEPALKTLPPRTLEKAFIEPFQEFFGRNGLKAGILLVLFIFLYKLGDSLATALATKFYLDMGFTKKQIGEVAKVAALWGGITGGFIGGFAMMKISINRALWIFGIIQLLVIPLFAWLSMQTTPNLFSLGGVVAAEAFGVGLGTAAFVAFIAQSTHPAYTAAQLALLTSLASLPRTVVNGYAGYMVDSLGYTNFFWVCTALAIPGLLLLPVVAPLVGAKPVTLEKSA